MMGMLGYIAVGCACTSLVANIISIALPFWSYDETPEETFYVGLWTYCGESALMGKICQSLTNAPGYLIAVRALEITGLLFGSGAGLIGAITLCTMKENHRLNLLARVLSGLAGSCTILGAIVFVVATMILGMPGSALHAGFGLAIGSGVTAFIASVLFYFAPKFNPTLTQERHHP